MNTRDNKNWIKSTALKIGLVVLIAVAFIFAKTMGFLGGSVAEVAEVAESHSKSNEEDHAIQILSESINDMKARLPMVIDEVTTLEKVDLDGLTINYKYKVDLAGFNASEISEIALNAKKGNTNILCSDPDVLEVLAAGIKYRYTYYNVDNNNIPSFEVTKAVCDKL